MLYRIYLEFLKINRWIYDPSRGIPIDTRNPQKSHSIEKSRLSDKEIEEIEKSRERRSTADSSTHRGLPTHSNLSRRPTRAATSVRLQEKILAQSTPHESDSDNESENENEGVTDDKLLRVYEQHKETGRACATPWKTIMSELQRFTKEKLTPHKIKQRVKQLGEPISKPTPTPRAMTKPKRSTVVDIDDDDDSVSARYAARFDKMESKMNKVAEQWSIATAENAEVKKQNKSLQNENYKLSESLKKGILHNSAI